MKVYAAPPYLELPQLICDREGELGFGYLVWSNLEGIHVDTVLNKPLNKLHFFLFYPYFTFYEYYGGTTVKNSFCRDSVGLC